MVEDGAYDLQEDAGLPAAFATSCFPCTGLDGELCFHPLKPTAFLHEGRREKRCVRVLGAHNSAAYTQLGEKKFRSFV